MANDNKDKEKLEDSKSQSSFKYGFSNEDRTARAQQYRQQLFNSYTKQMNSHSNKNNPNENEEDEDDDLGTYEDYDEGQGGSSYSKKKEEEKEEDKDKDKDKNKDKDPNNQNSQKQDNKPDNKTDKNIKEGAQNPQTGKNATSNVGKSPNATKNATKNAGNITGKATGKATKKATGKAAGKAATKAAGKVAGKAAASAATSGIGAFMAAGGWIPIVIILALILIFLIALLIGSVLSAAEQAPYRGVNPAEGEFATSMGITGDLFYGARLFYTDAVKSQDDLSSYYYAFAEDFLEKIDSSDSIELKISTNSSSHTNEMVKMIAKTVSGSTAELSIEDYLKLVPHFGYTNLQLDTIKTNLVNYIVQDKENIIEETFTPELLTSALNDIFDENYSNYNVTAPLYYVKDVILEELQSAMIPSQEQCNYVAFMFMPRKTVTVKDMSFMFYFPEESTDGYATNIDIDIVSVKEGNAEILNEFTADSTWWKDNRPVSLAEALNANVDLPIFTSIDLENPLEDVSIYSLITDDNHKVIVDSANSNSIIQDTIMKYFSSTLIEDGNGASYYNYDFVPNDSTYLYVKFDSDGTYLFCELLTEVKEK